MTSKRVALAVVAALALSLAAPPLIAKELAGVKAADTLSVGGKTLTLNGLGLRKKIGFKVYVGGLYLEAPSKDAAAIVAADAPKAIRMHFTRGIGKDKLVDAFKEGFENNTKDKGAAEKPAIDKFLSWVSDVKDGDAWTCSEQALIRLRLCIRLKDGYFVAWITWRSVTLGLRLPVAWFAYG